MKDRLNSIKVKVVAVPLVLLFLAMFSLGVVNSLLTRNSMLELKRATGLELLKQVDDRVEENIISLETLENLLENTLLSVINLVITNQAAISNDLLSQLAEHLQVDAIHWYNPEGVITNSAYGEYIGWTAPDQTHPVAQFQRSGEKYLVEEIRRDTESDNYFKYAYGRAADGSIIQVGINANDVQALTEQFALEPLLKDLVSSDEILYAAVFNDEQLLAGSDAFSREQLLADKSKEEAVAARRENAVVFDHVLTGEKVYDLLMPVHIRGEYYGYLNIGFSMADVYAAIRYNLTLGAVIGLVFFVVVGLILYLVSINIVRSIMGANKHLDILLQATYSSLFPRLC